MSKDNSTDANLVPSGACSLSPYGPHLWTWHTPSNQIPDQIMPHSGDHGLHSYLFVQPYKAHSSISENTTPRVASRRYNFSVPRQTSTQRLGKDELQCVLNAISWHEKTANKTKDIISKYNERRRGEQLRAWAVEQTPSARKDGVWIIIDDPPRAGEFRADGRSKLSLEDAKRSVTQQAPVQSSQPSYQPAPNADFGLFGSSRIDRPPSGALMLSPFTPYTQPISFNQRLGSQSGNTLASNTDRDLGGASQLVSRSPSSRTSLRRLRPYPSQSQCAVLHQPTLSLTGAADSNSTDTQVDIAARQNRDSPELSGLPTEAEMLLGERFNLSAVYGPQLPSGFLDDMPKYPWTTGASAYPDPTDESTRD